MTLASECPRIVIFGATGQVGSALARDLSRAAHTMSPTSAEVTFEDPGAVRRFLMASNATAVVNAAAYTSVDAAEGNRDRAFIINAETPGVIAEACASIGARLVHVSTDYVFDGTGTLPYLADSPTRPLNVYGETKADGERRILDALPRAVIVRTAWLHSATGANFVRTAVSILSRGGSMRVVDDQVGTPTVASTVVEVIARILSRPHVHGILHATDAGVATWFDVACCVRDTLAESGRVPRGSQVIPVSTAQHGRPARRPPVSILDTYETRKALDWTPPHWRLGVIRTTRDWITSVLP